MKHVQTTLRAHAVYKTSHRRRCNVMTLHRRCYHAVSTLRARKGHLFYQKLSEILPRSQLLPTLHLLYETSFKSENITSSTHATSLASKFGVQASSTSNYFFMTLNEPVTIVVKLQLALIISSTSDSYYTAKFQTTFVVCFVFVFVFSFVCFFVIFFVVCLFFGFFCFVFFFFFVLFFFFFQTNICLERSLCVKLKN